MAQHEDIVTVNFFVPDQEEQNEDLEVRGEQISAKHIIKLAAVHSCNQ